MHGSPHRCWLNWQRKARHSIKQNARHQKPGFSGLFVFSVRCELKIDGKISQGLQNFGSSGNFVGKEQFAAFFNPPSFPPTPAGMTEDVFAKPL